jgi:hypothetical protein
MLPMLNTGDGAVRERRSTAFGFERHSRWGCDMRFTESMEAAYRRGYQLASVAHVELSAAARSNIAAVELNDLGVNGSPSQNFAATLPPPREILDEYRDDEQTAFFIGWLDGASGSSKYRDSAEGGEQLSMNL